MPQRLWMDEIVSVGLVPKGDNDEAQVTIWKKAVDKHALPGSLDERVDVIRRAWREDNPERDGQPYSYVSSVFPTFVLVEEGERYFRVPYMVSESDDVTFGAREEVDLDTDIVSKMRDGKAASGMVDDKTGGTGRDIKDTAVDLPDLSVIEDDDLRDDIDKSFTDLQSQVDDLTEQLAEATEEPEGDDGPGPLEKADPVVKAELDRLRKERDEDREALEAEVAKRRDAEFIGKDYMPLLGDPDEIGPVVRKLADAEPEAFEQVETALKALQGRDELGAILKEYGTSGGDADPKSRQQAWVEKNRDQFDSDAEARAAFWKTDEGRQLRKLQAEEQRS